jgi:hypothetical protein
MYTNDMPRNVRRERRELVVSRSVVSGTCATAAPVIFPPVVFASAAAGDDEAFFPSSS